MFLKFFNPRTGEKQRLLDSLTRDKERLDGECDQILQHITFLQAQHRERTNARLAISAALAALSPEDRAIGAQAQKALEDELSLLDFSPETSPSPDEHPGRPLRGLTAAVACVGALFFAVPADAAGDFENGAVAALIAKEYCPGFNVTDEKLGTWIFLAAAEMGQSDIGTASLSLAASSVVKGRQLEEAGQMRQFCQTMRRILAE